MAVEAVGGRAGVEEGKDWAHRAVLSRMPELCPENTSAVVSGMSTCPGGPREQLGATGSLWPSEPIILGPKESARQLVLRKIQELTLAVRRESGFHPFLAGTQECFPVYSLEAIRLGFPGACTGILSKLRCSFCPLGIWVCSQPHHCLGLKPSCLWPWSTDSCLPAPF